MQEDAAAHPLGVAGPGGSRDRRPMRSRARAIPAKVPGVVHLDLMRAGLIPDPYLDDNESRLALDRARRLDVRDRVRADGRRTRGAQRHELVFDGLDTVATVSLNDVVIARSRTSIAPIASTSPSPARRRERARRGLPTR